MNYVIHKLKLDITSLYVLVLGVDYIQIHSRFIPKGVAEAKLVSYEQ
jgi:hypothetical protein